MRADKLHGSWGNLFLSKFRKSDCGLCGYRYRYYRERKQAEDFQRKTTQKR
jgi:hypothetical protein